MAAFTAENAAIMAQRRWTAERERKAQPRILPAPCDEQTAINHKDAELARTQAQIEELNTQLDQCDDFKAWDALTRAKERLFRIWAHLAGIPGPGNLKPSQPRQNTRKELPPPTVAQAQPSAQQAGAEAGQAGPVQG